MNPGMGVMPLPSITRSPRVFAPADETDAILPPRTMIVPDSMAGSTPAITRTSFPLLHVCRDCLEYGGTRHAGTGFRAQFRRSPSCWPTSRKNAASVPIVCRPSFRDRVVDVEAFAAAALALTRASGATGQLCTRSTTKHTEVRERIGRIEIDRQPEESAQRLTSQVSM